LQVRNVQYDRVKDRPLTLIKLATAYNFTIYIWKIIILSWDPIGLTPAYCCVCLKLGPCLFMVFL